MPLGPKKVGKSFSPLRFGSNPALSADTGRTARRPDLSLISLVPGPEFKAEDSAKLA